MLSTGRSRLRVSRFSACGWPVAPRRDDTGRRALPGADWFGLAAYAAAIVLYVLIGVLAVRGGL